MSDVQYEHNVHTLVKTARNINTIPFFMKFYSVLKHLPNSSPGVRPKYAIQTDKLLSEHNIKLGHISDRPQISQQKLNSLSDELNKYSLKIDALCSRYSNSFRTVDRTLSIGGTFYDTSKLDEGTWSCSAPTSSNYIEWWNMVVVAKIKMITMLTGFVEKSAEKSFRYFPQSPYHLHGNGYIDKTSFIVIDHMIDPNTTSFRAIVCKTLVPNYYGIDGLEFRELQIVEIEILDKAYRIVENHLHHTRTIVHLHYTKWIDRQDIEPTIMLELVSAYGAVYTDLCLRENNSNNSDNSQTVQNLIHCSAGVGRTGTFYVTVRMIRHVVVGSIKYKHSPLDIYINVPEYVLVCRRCRLESVQNASQLQLIYKTLGTFCDMLKIG